MNNEIKEYINNAIQEALAEQTQAKCSPRAFQPTFNKWFRDETGYIPYSKMGREFNSGPKAYAIWNRVRPIVTAIFDCTHVVQIEYKNQEYANEIADRILQVIYDCKVEYNERKKEKTAENK